MKRLRPALLLVLLLLLWPSGANAAVALPRGALADELVLKLRPGAALSSQALARGPHAVDLNRLLRGAGTGVARRAWRAARSVAGLLGWPAVFGQRYGHRDVFERGNG